MGILLSMRKKNSSKANISSNTKKKKQMSQSSILKYFKKEKENKPAVSKDIPNRHAGADVVEIKEDDSRENITNYNVLFYQNELKSEPRGIYRDIKFYLLKRHDFIFALSCFWLSLYSCLLISLFQIQFLIPFPPISDILIDGLLSVCFNNHHLLYIYAYYNLQVTTLKRFCKIGMETTVCWKSTMVTYNG